MNVRATRKDFMIVNMGPHHPSMHAFSRVRKPFYKALGQVSLKEGMAKGELCAYLNPRLRPGREYSSIKGVLLLKVLPIIQKGLSEEGCIASYLLAKLLIRMGRNQACFHTSRCRIGPIPMDSLSRCPKPDSAKAVVK